MDDVLSAITEPRYKWVKGKAKELREQHCEDKIPVILNEIVQAFGINVRGAELDIDGVARIDANGICLIMYNTKASRERQRFTVAHELGHIALEHIGLGCDSSQLSGKSQEAEANAFAGELLIPTDDLRVFVKGGSKTIEDIMERYWVSKDAATIAVLGNRLINKIRIPTTK